MYHSPKIKERRFSNPNQKNVDFGLKLNPKSFLLATF